ncbi:uncharacterized protein [Malus domestica]|uniref:uncharacterized protein isoform X2 n=1 Tax=Malus domestica TaxID=3750 RepID=UPI003975D7DE
MGAIFVQIIVKRNLFNSVCRGFVGFCVWFTPLINLRFNRSSKATVGLGASIGPALCCSFVVTSIGDEKTADHSVHLFPKEN